MSRLRKGAMIAVASALTVLLVAVAVRQITFARYRARIDAEIKLLRAEGGSPEVRDLLPKPLGQREGPGVALLEPRDIESPYTRTPYFPNAFASAQSGLEAKTVISSTQIDYGNWRGANFGPDSVPSSPLWNTRWNDGWQPWLERLVSENRALLDKAREIADGGDAMFRPDWTEGTAVLFPHLHYMRSLGRYLSVEAALKARVGDVDGALENVRVMLRLRRPIDNEPCVDSKSVTYAMDAVTFSTLDLVLRQGRAGRPAVEKILAELDGREGQNRMTDALLGETAIGIDTFARTRRDPMLLKRPYSRPAGSRGNWHLEDGLEQIERYALRIAWVWPADELNYLEEMRGLRATSRLGVTQALKVPAVSPNAPPGGTLGGKLLPDARAALSQEAHADARVAMVRVMLALHLYRQDQGSYPATLDVLAPKYLPKVQIDPFDGKPLRYKPTEKGYVMYSIGADCVDNGGAPKSDIVWQREDL